MTVVTFVKSYNYIIIALFIAIALSSKAEGSKKPFKIDDCSASSKHAAVGVLNNVEITDCPNDMKDEKCVMQRGTKKAITIEFTPKVRLESVRVSVVGKISLIPITFPLKPDEACGNYGLDCPLEANKPAKFTLELPILHEYPKVSVAVEIKLLDGKAPITCIQFPAKIR